MTDASSLGLDFNQTWTTFTGDTNHVQDAYQFIARYRIQLTAYLSYSAEGGISLERGEGVDQTAKTVRNGIDFAMGELSAKLSYEYTDEKFLTETRERNFGSFSLKRTF